MESFYLAWINLVENLKILVRVPEEIRDGFWEQLLDNNRRLMTVISILAALVQAVNIFHVLMGSESGLETLNNRIYFAFYCTFLLINLGFLAAQEIFRKKQWKKRQIFLQGGYCAVGVVWNCMLNYYDITKAQDGWNLSVIVTCIMGSAIIVQALPIYALSVYGGASLAFSLAAFPYIQFGGLINVTVAGGMAVIASSARYWYKVKELSQQREIRKINQQLIKEGEELSLSLEKIRLLMDKMDHIIYEWDIEKGQISFSAKWIDKFGEDTQITDDLQWLEQTRCMTSEEKGKLLNGVEKAMEQKKIFEEEIQLTDKEGSTQWYLLRLYFQYGKDGEARSGVGFLINIQKQKEELETLEGEMSRDYLTGVMNRKGIQEYAESELKKKDRDRQMAMILIDLDNFKKVNDRYGHPFGDQVLIRTGERLSEIFRSYGFVGRIGGDEFMAVFAVKDQEELKDKIRELRDRPVLLEQQGEMVKTEFCAGTAVAAPEDTYQTLYQKADQALYKAKNTGRGETYLAG